MLTESPANMRRTDRVMVLLPERVALKRDCSTAALSIVPFSPETCKMTSVIGTFPVF